jgi:hypothetical protein
MFTLITPAAHTQVAFHGLCNFLEHEEAFMAEAAALQKRFTLIPGANH